MALDWAKATCGSAHSPTESKCKVLRPRAQTRNQGPTYGRHARRARRTKPPMLRSATLTVFHATSACILSGQPNLTETECYVRITSPGRANAQPRRVQPTLIYYAYGVPCRLSVHHSGQPNLRLSGMQELQPRAQTRDQGPTYCRHTRRGTNPFHRGADRRPYEPYVRHRNTNKCQTSMLHASRAMPFLVVCPHYFRRHLSPSVDKSSHYFKLGTTFNIL
jgi:hypothetical protein